MCKSVHRLTQGPLNNEGMKFRLDFVNTHDLCYICLLDNHVTKDCLSKRSCDICDKSWHNTILHQNNSTAVVSNQAITHVASMLPVVKVKINGRHVTNALIDSGSSNSFIAAKLADSLNLRGTKTMLNMSTMNSVSRKRTFMYNIVMSDLNDSQRINLPRVYATESIPVPRVRIDLDQLKHLDGVTPGDPSDVGCCLVKTVGLCLYHWKLVLVNPMNPMLHASLLGGILQVLLEWTVLLMSVALISVLANHLLNSGTNCGALIMNNLQT